jgi:hypothetical protein
LFKVVNAAPFALSAVPIYVLAYRLLSPWWSVFVVPFAVTPIVVSELLRATSRWLEGRRVRRCVPHGERVPAAGRGRLREHAVRLLGSSL